LTKISGALSPRTGPSFFIPFSVFDFYFFTIHFLFFYFLSFYYPFFAIHFFIFLFFIFSSIKTLSIQNVRTWYTTEESNQGFMDMFVRP